MLSKKKITIIVIIIVIIGVAIAILLTDESFFSPLATQDQLIAPEDQLTDEPNQNSNENSNLPIFEIKEESILPVIKLSPNEQTLLSVARSFAERYGSYSTDSNFDNLRESRLLTTSSFAQKLDKLIETSFLGEEFYGISSKVVKSKILELNEDNARVELNVQRQESKQGQDYFVSINI